MKKILTILLVLLSFVASSQIINTGTRITFSGDIIFYTEIDWINNANNNVTQSPTSNIIFGGSQPQTIRSGINEFSNITINNSSSANHAIILDDDLTTNNINLINGIVNTNSYVLTLSTSNIGNQNSFVDGKVRTTNLSSNFTFPTGNINNRDIGLPGDPQDYKIWAPIRVNPTTTPATITVEYKFSNENLPTWWYHDWTHEHPLTHTTDREYWLVTSNRDLEVTLYWRNNNPCVIHDFCNPGFLPQYLTIAYWDNIWKDAGITAEATDFVNDQITSSINIPFDGTRFVTFGSTDAELPLPVELLTFESFCVDNDILIEWTTASEFNSDYYVLERSSDGVNFYEIEVFSGAGFSNRLLEYEYIDMTPYRTHNYYRLTQYDFDGKYQVFNTIGIRCDFTTNVSVYPIPFVNDLYIDFDNVVESTIYLYDIDGRLIGAYRYISDKVILNLGHLKTGQYMLRTILDNTEYINKIIKETYR